jgi:GST-like protein
MSKDLFFPARWPAKHPDLIQLYSLATPNGQKVAIALEEMGLAYEAHTIDIMNNDQFDEDYLRLNPNGKIPSLSDPNGPEGDQLLSMESGAILLYLAEKTGQFLPKEPMRRQQTIQWLFFQMGHIGPMFGQFGHFNNYAGDKCDHPYPRDRYLNETRRLLGVLNSRLEGRQFIMEDDYTIADIAIWPWVDCLIRFYQAGEALEIEEFGQVMRWYKEISERPAVQKGQGVCNPWA